MNSKIKKLLCMLAALAVLAAFGVFAIASGESDTDEDEKTEDQGSDAATKEENKPNLGDYSVEIKSSRLAENYQGKAVLIVKYGFTNHADSAKSFMVAIDEVAYQDGIGLNESYILADSANYSNDNQMKEIKPGATLDVEVAYELNDETTDVEIEVSEYFSFNDKKITKTFKIAK